MNILHVVPSYFPAVRYGGPIVSVHGLCKGLVELGHKVTVFTTNADGDGESDVPIGERVLMDGVEVFYFKRSFPARLFYATGLRRALAEAIPDYDVVHVHSVFLWPTWIAGVLAARNHVPYVVSPRGMLVAGLMKQKSSLFKYLWLLLVGKTHLTMASGVHLTSEVENQEFQTLNERFSGLPVFVIPNGIDIPEPSYLSLVDEDIRMDVSGEYVLYFGRLSWEKNLENLLRSMAEGKSEFKLVVAGVAESSGYVDQLLELIRSLQLEQRVTVIPRLISGESKEFLFRHSSVFVLPSLSENFGITVVEALGRGIPVVTNNHVGSADLVNRTNSGVLVDDGDYAGAIKTLLSDKTELMAMGERGKQEVKQSYSWRTVGEEMAGFYSDLVSET